VAIREARGRSELTQEKLAAKARLNIKTVKRVEKGERVHVGTLRAIASALDVPLRQVRIPDIGGGDSVEECLEEAIRADTAADFTCAIEMAQALAAQMDEADPLFLDVIVRLASFFDHDGRWEDALLLLKSQAMDPVLLESADSGKLEWARYQYALIQRVGAENLLAHTGGRMTKRIEKLLDSAERLLVELARSEQRSMRVSAAHQLGVVELVRGELDSAASLFTQCIRQRARRRPQSPGIWLRLAYSYRRRAMVRANMARLQDARRDWHKAEALARRAPGHDNKRLLREIERDRMAWLDGEPSVG